MASWGALTGAAGAQEAAPATVAGVPATDPATATSAAPSPPNVVAAPESFFISAFDVKGVTSLDQSTVEEVVYDFLGPDKTTADVEAARQALQAAYARRGFESVQVDILPQPEVQFATGLIEITVTEAPVGKVTVTGARHHSADRARRDIPSLVEGKPLNVRDLQIELASANRFPDREVSPSFNQGETPGTIDVELEVDDKFPLHGSLELNNDRGPSTRPLRLNASLRYTNMFGLGHTISGSYIVAPQDRSQSEVFSGSYLAPLNGTPWSFLLYGFKSNSNVAALGGVNVLGDGYQIGGRAIYRLPGNRVGQSVTFGLDYKNFNQNIALGDAAVSAAPIEYVPLYASYDLTLGTEKSTLDVTVSATAGLRAFKKIRCFEVDAGDNCAESDQFQNRALDSKENFIHGNIEVNYRRSFAGDFIAAFKANGQIADNPLPANEQIGIGGLTSVRGYLLSEDVGDVGYAVSLELNSPSVASKLPSLVDELRVFGFVEHGQIRLLQTLPDQTRQDMLLSVGGGFRVRLFGTLSGELSVGVPLLDGLTTQANDARAQFTAKGEF